MKDNSIFIVFSIANVIQYTTTNMTLEEWRNKNNTATIIKAFYSSNDISTYDEDIKQNFLNSCYYLGLQPSDLGRQFKHPKTGHMMEIVGYKPRNNKYPMIIKDMVTNQRFKVTPRFVVNNLGP